MRHALRGRSVGRHHEFSSCGADGHADASAVSAGGLMAAEAGGAEPAAGDLHPLGAARGLPQRRSHVPLL